MIKVKFTSIATIEDDLAELQKDNDVTSIGTVDSTPMILYRKRNPSWGDMLNFLDNAKTELAVTDNLSKENRELLVKCAVSFMECAQALKDSYKDE